MANLALDWLHIVVLLGAVQGLFLTGALATKRRNRTANRLLSAATLAFSIGLATSVYHAAGLAIALDVMRAAGLLGMQRQDDDVDLAVAILVYSIGYKGLRQPEIFRYETAEYPVPMPKPTVEPPSIGGPAAPTVQGVPSYERSGLTDREAVRLKESLLTAMDKDQPWKNSELNLADLAERLGTTPHRLSEVLNAELGQWFYDFVNGYRVREVQRRIKSGEGRALKILSLALDAGFASKSTFNLVFKKHTGTTPSTVQAG